MKTKENNNNKNFIVQYTWCTEPSLLSLVSNVDGKFQFVDLTHGRIRNLVFDSIEEAEQFLEKFTEILERNVNINPV